MSRKQLQNNSLYFISLVTGVGVVLFFTFLIAFLTPSTPDGVFVYPQRLSGRPFHQLADLQHITLADGWDANRFLLAGDLYREAGDLVRATQYWQLSLQANPDQADVQITLARTLLELEFWAQAQHSLEVVIQHDPQATWAQYQLGLVYLIGSPQRALPLFQTVMQDSVYQTSVTGLISILEQVDEPAERWLRLGAELAQQEQWAIAEQVYQQVANIYAIPEAYAYHGLIRQRQGKDGQVSVEYALTVEPDNARIQLIYGLYLRSLGEDQASLSYFQRAIALDPANPTLYAEYAIAYQRIGDLRLARQWLEQAVELSNHAEPYTALLEDFEASEMQLIESFDEFFSADEMTAEATPEVTSTPELG